MINIVTFKWKKTVNQNGGYNLPMSVDQYTSNHVNILYNSIKRNTTVDFKFTCVTDDPEGLLPEIEYVPLWDKCKGLGACYNRLYVFSKDMKDILGDRFMCIDLDVVITGSIDHILGLQEDFIIQQYGTPAIQERLQRKKQSGYKQYYNGGLFMLDAGSRDQLWSEFEYETTDQLLCQYRENKSLPKHSRERKKYSLVGSDQAWISYKLGNGEKVVGLNEGIYAFSRLKNDTLPEDACIVSFAGKKDPSEFLEISWVNKHWRK